MMSTSHPSTPRLFAVYLGGRAPECNTELHDVVFAVGDSIEQTYQRLLEKWFGAPVGLHIDSWIELVCVDGFRVTLQRTPPSTPDRLFFINLGAYRPGEFSELHANMFVVARTEDEAKARAKRELLPGTESLHTDDLYDVDDCLQLDELDGYHVHLRATEEPSLQAPASAYHPIPKAVIAAYVAALSRPAT